jgi:hypothetical protein
MIELYRTRNGVTETFTVDSKTKARDFFHYHVFKNYDDYGILGETSVKGRTDPWENGVLIHHTEA